MAAVVLFVLFCGPLASAFLVEESCRGRCHKYEAGRTCNCNDFCIKFHDCCKDYKVVCGTCVGECGSSYDSSRSCQCNDLCSQYGNCCDDYSNVCSQAALSPKIADELWRIDVHRFEPSEMTINYGAQLNVSSSTSSSADKSPNPLFTKVDESRFSHPIYKTFINLINNYNLNQGNTSTDQSEVDAFLDAVFTSEVTRTAYAHILQNNYTSGSLIDYRTTLKDLWFTPFSLNGTGASDTSGFQSMVLGEQYTSSFTGPHNWIGFYLQEKTSRVDYQGYYKKTDFMVETLLTSNSQTATSSFFIGSSPAFDINIATICALSRKRSCHYSISNTNISLVVNTRGLSVTNAYPAL